MNKIQPMKNNKTNKYVSERTLEIIELEEQKRMKLDLRSELRAIKRGNCILELDD